MKILVGYTGLIGQTLSERMKFDLVFNSKNINQFDMIELQSGSEIYLSCLPATKWQVNKNLTKDMENIFSILEILRKKTYSKVVVFSTIDVYNHSPLGVDENYWPNIGHLSYGSNRYLFELMVREYLKTDELRIFRLPALFNKHIKKNVLFDLLNNNNVENININSAYQWYNLDNLERDIENYTNLNKHQTVFNLFPEPVETVEILKLFPEYNKFEDSKRVEYDYRTIFGGYIHSKEKSLEEIRAFVNESRSK